MLLENVIREFDELGVHAVYDPMRGARHDAHDLVDEARVRIDDAFKGLPRQRQHSRLKSLTGGDGSFTMDFSHYAEVPVNELKQLKAAAE